MHGGACQTIGKKEAVHLVCKTRNKWKWTCAEAEGSSWFIVIVIAVVSIVIIIQLLPSSFYYSCYRSYCSSSSSWLRFGPGQYRLLRCTILLRLLLISLLKSAYTTGFMAEFTIKSNANTHQNVSTVFVLTPSCPPVIRVYTLIMILQR